jgi:hypothetical protein
LLPPAQQHSDHLGDIHGTAATNSDDAIDIMAAAQLGCSQHHRFRRILPHLVEYHRGQVLLFQCRQHRLHQANSHQARIGDQQWLEHTQLAALRRQFQRAAGTIDQSAYGIEFKALH